MNSARILAAELWLANLHETAWEIQENSTGDWSQSELAVILGQIEVLTD